MAADLCGPLGDVIQQNLKSGHAVSEVSLEHPTACCWHLLKPIHDSFIMINAQWTFEIKVANGNSLSQPNLEFFLIWREETSGAQASENEDVIVDELHSAVTADWFSWAGEKDSVKLAWNVVQYWSRNRCTGPATVIQKGLVFTEHTVWGFSLCLCW